MSRYVDAELAKAEFTGNFREEYPTSLIKAIIDEVPTADVEEVVRCKDCWAYETAEYDGGYKKRVCRLFKRQMQEDDFCSYGEPPDSFEKHSIAKMDEKENKE